MYHFIIRNRVKALFDAINHGDAEPVINSFAERFEHVFLGNSALGGVRTSREKTREWYARLYRLLPDIRFDLDRITVAGGPWNTLVIAHWTETNSGTDGVETRNAGIHALHLSWGKARRLVICPDTAALVESLERMAAHGTAEATAPMIEG